MAWRWINTACAVVLVQVCRLLCEEPTASAQESGLELVKQAVLQRGDVTIRTGEFRYQLSIVENAPSNETIDTRVEQIRSSLREQLKLHANNPAMSDRIQKAIDTAHEYVPEQVRQNANLLMQYYFVLGGPALGGDRYLEISVFNREKNAFGNGRTLLLRSIGSGKGTSLEFDSGTGMALAAGLKDVFQPSQEPQRLGRAVGLLPQLVSGNESGADDERILQSIMDVMVNPVQGKTDVETVEVTFKVKASDSLIVSLLYRVVPSRGFVTPLVQESESGKLRFEWKCEDYFQPAGSELWYPKSCEFRDYSLPNPEPRLERYTFDGDGVVLNNDIPDERFQVSIPRGTPLVDALADGNKQYVAKLAISLSSDDLARLSEFDGLGPGNPIIPEGIPIADNTSGKWLVGVNVIVFVLVAWVILKKKRPKVAGVVLLLSSSALLAGCSPTVDGSSQASDQTSDQALIRVEPEIVDLGEVGTDLGVLDFVLKVQNVSEQTVNVEIQPECGCTVIEDPTLVLPGGSSRTAGVALSLRGRIGKFENVIHVFCQPADSTKPKRRLDIPVHANLLDHWRASPQRLVLRNEGVGSVAISAPADAWNGVIAEALGTDVDFTQTSLKTEGKLETRTFRVKSTSKGIHGGNSGIGFRRRDSDRCFLTVPVLVK